MISDIKKDVGMGLVVYSLYNMSFLHTAIPTPSFCSFWHGHPYIPIHFLKMFFILVPFVKDGEWISMNEIVMAFYSYCTCVDVSCYENDNCSSL